MNDDELDAVAVGRDIGDTVRCISNMIAYCSNCGALLKNYSATITGVRGVPDRKTIYWITRNCCGLKTSVVTTEILS